MDDVIGNYDSDNYLEIHSNSYQPTTISGRAEVFPVFEYDLCPTAGQPGMSHISTIDTLPSELASATQGAADTNPSRPKVSIPIAIAELRDLPGKLLKSGRERGPLVRNSSATGQFGWQSFFTDFINLIRFTEQVEQRRKMLDHLYNQGGASARGRTWASQGYAIYTDFPLHTNEAYIAGRVSYHTNVRRWTVTKWKPSTPGLRSAGDLTQQARLAVHGWRVSPADVWELLPWSWFIDYFWNIGDFLQASDNSIAYIDGPTCVMTHYVTTMAISLETGTGGFSVRTGKATLEDKFRTLSTVGLTATAPFLSARQLTNLVGIAANLGIG